MSLQANKEMDYQEMIDKYSNMVYRLAYFYTNSKYDADDVYQDVFMQYFKSSEHFENEEHKKAWLIRVTKISGEETLSIDFIFETSKKS